MNLWFQHLIVAAVIAKLNSKADDEAPKPKGGRKKKKRGVGSGTKQEEATKFSV